MKNYFKILFIFLAISFFSLACTPAQEPNRIGKNTAPDFRLQTLKGDRVSLSSYKNKQAVILFFWTTWCPFCVKELKRLTDEYPELSREGLEVLAINIGENVDKVNNFAKRHSLLLKVLLDKDTAVANSYNIVGVPTFILIDKKGDIAFTDNYFQKEKYKGYTRK